MFETVVQVLRSQFARFQSLATQDDVLISPLLTQTILWFSSHYLRVYIFPNRSLYSDAELATHTQLFTLYDEASAGQYASFLVELTNMFVHVWPFEDSVISVACDNLTAIVRARAAPLLVSLPSFQQLFSDVFVSPEKSILPRKPRINSSCLSSSFRVN